MLSNWLLEEASIPATNSQRLLVAQCIRLLAKEGGTLQDAAQFILEKAQSAIADGECVNTFWFTDQRYKPQKPQKSKRQKENEARAKEFMEAATDD